ncbi:MAG: ABC transporter permease [Eubacterium sp.]|nr:ABC transporter permease [Eubacterium sp.]
MKILRLSLFNIKKHKKESFVIIFLIMVSMALLGIGIINMEKADRMFDEVIEKTGSYYYIILFPGDDTYKNEFKEVLDNDERVTRTLVFDSLQFLASTSMSYKKEDGSAAQFQAMFITESSERKLEKFDRNEFFSDDEIDKMEHPIWVPYYLKYDMGFKEGDDLILILGGKDYPFQIAGFYESGLASGVSSGGIKCILTDDDYDMMSVVVPTAKRLAFDTKDEVVKSYDDSVKLVKEYEEKFEDISGKDMELFFDGYYAEKLSATSPVEIIMAIVSFISFVTAISCFFMIRHKITNDIEDQMESIGVLEALGYRSKEISGAYIYEYLVLSFAGILIGGIVIFATDPLMTRVIQAFIGHDHVASGNIALLLIPAVLLIVLTLITALGRARKIKKYPPVVAFRKGIKTHHFGRNVLPIENTKSDINRRLGLKGLVTNKGQNLGMFACILAASLTITFCICLTDLFKDRGAVFLDFAGLEKALMVGFDTGTDYEEVRQEIGQREDVRKCFLFRGNYGFSINGNDIDTFQTFAYEDFDELENLHISEGRFPLHDNEIMIGTGMAEKYDISAGDSVLVKYNGIEKTYIISGTTKAFINGGMIGYMTTDGFCQFMPPSECLNYLFVYAADGVSEAELKDRLSDEYGSVEDTVGESFDEGSYEERIRAKADEQMALLKSKYGVSNASYAIKIGDKIITGNSGSFKLTEISSFGETIDTSIGGISVMSQIVSVILIIIISIIVSIIINFLIESIIKKERQAMGIEKSMGYTSKDIRKQIIVRMMPVAIPGIIVGSILAIPVTMMFMKVAFSTYFGIRLIWVPIAAVLITLYVYVSTYISAGKVRKVSVTELMTE